TRGATPYSAQRGCLRTSWREDTGTLTGTSIGGSRSSAGRGLMKLWWPVCVISHTRQAGRNSSRSGICSSGRNAPRSCCRCSKRFSASSESARPGARIGMIAGGPSPTLETLSEWACFEMRPYNFFMTIPILGLHHVTATVDDAQDDLDFCTEALGLRLVKKTVNFDNHNVYHFYYGDERGTPGTIWTTFPYKGRGVPIGRKGAGQITVTSFSVPANSLGFWKNRLRAHGVVVEDVNPRFGDEAIACSDRSGLQFELVGNDRDPRVPWLGSGIGPADAV